MVNVKTISKYVRIPDEHDESRKFHVFLSRFLTVLCSLGAALGRKLVRADPY